MLERVDRVQVVVRDRAVAARTFAALLGAEIVREAPSAHLGARRTVLALGESEVELCEPSGTGLADEHLRRWGEGLLAAGFAVSDPARLRAHLTRQGASVVTEGDQMYLAPPDTGGMRVVLTPAARASRHAGPVSFLYEVTNTVADWRAAADRYAALFGLDAARFSRIDSERFGYTGTLTLFDPPRRLDRIEVIEVTDPAAPMGRWVARRGDSLYMAYVEATDVGAIADRLSAAGARWTPRGADAKAERDGLWIHPSALHGLLLGVSRTTLAWEWSGRPELVAPA